MHRDNWIFLSNSTLQMIKIIELNILYNYYIIFGSSVMIKTKTNNRHAHQSHETTVERLQPQFYLGRQIALVVDLVE